MQCPICEKTGCVEGVVGKYTFYCPHCKKRFNIALCKCGHHIPVIPEDEQVDCVIIHCTGCQKPMITLKGNKAQLEDVEYNVKEQFCKDCYTSAPDTSQDNTIKYHCEGCDTKTNDVEKCPTCEGLICKKCWASHVDNCTLESEPDG